MLLEKEIQKRIEEARQKGTLAKLLYSSIANNQPEIVVQFLKQPGKVTADAIKSLQIANVLQMAVKKNQFEIVKLLLEKYGEVDDAIKVLFIPRALEEAAKSNHLKVIEQIINEYKNVSLSKLCIFKVLEAAAINGYDEIVKLLLDHYDPDANKINNLAISNSLQMAAYNGQLKVVARFLEYYDKDANKIDNLNIVRVLGKAAEMDQIEIEIYIFKKYHNDHRFAEIETLEDVVSKIESSVLDKIESKDMRGILSLIKTGFSTKDKRLFKHLTESDILQALELQKAQPEALEAIKLINSAYVLFIKHKKDAIKNAQATLKHSAAILTDLQRMRQ